MAPFSAVAPGETAKLRLKAAKTDSVVVAGSEPSSPTKRKLPSRLPLYVCPSMLACDFGKLGQEMLTVLDAGADWVHLDVMDGHFVPNISFGFPVIKSLRTYSTSAFFDVHMMVTQPLRFLKDLQDCGADQVTIHVEAMEAEELPGCVRDLKAAGFKVGVAVKPGTPVESALELIRETGCVDLLLVMTVEPGFGGQKFQSAPLDKVRLARSAFPDLSIQVDGGVDAGSVSLCGTAGANSFVAGSAVFKAKDPAAAVSALRANAVVAP